MTNVNKKDVDIAIYNHRTLNILEKAIAKIEVVKKIWYVVDKEDLDRTLLTEKGRKIVNALQTRYRKYSAEDHVKELRQRSSLETLTILDDNTLSSLFDYFEENTHFQANIYSDHCQVPRQCELFKKCLSEIKNSVAAHQGETLSQEKAREEHLRLCRLKNEQTAKEISSLEKELIDKKSDFNASIIGKNLLVNRQQAKIERIRKVTQEAIDWRVAECESVIEADQEASATTQQELQGELLDRTQKYDASLKENLETEKLLRTQRTKIENQFSTWMQTFDHDMEEKQAEEEELLAEFEREKKKYEKVQKQLDEQEEEYDELMQEKAAYEQQLIEQKLFMFILNRSARRIQRAFRAYKLRKLAKKAKKGKKGKAKKK